MTQEINAQLIDIISILSRVDATTNQLARGQEQFAQEIDHIQHALQDVNQRLTVLETLDIRNLRAQHQAEINALRSQVTSLEGKVHELTHHHGTVKAWVVQAVQFISSIGVLYLAYKMGINP